MPADGLTTRRANRHVCRPLIFIELPSEQLLSDVTTLLTATVSRIGLLLRRAGSRPALLATVGVFRMVLHYEAAVGTPGRPACPSYRDSCGG